jgi:hypothetical protein
MNRDNGNNDLLQQTLQAWEAPLELPPRFQAEVWRRIADRETEPTFWENASALLTTLFTQPGRVALVLAATLALSAGAALTQARQENNRQWQTLQSRYFQSINPLSSAHSPSHGPA